MDASVDESLHSAYYGDAGDPGYDYIPDDPWKRWVKWLSAIITLLLIAWCVASCSPRTVAVPMRDANTIRVGEVKLTHHQYMRYIHAVQRSDRKKAFVVTTYVLLVIGSLIFLIDWYE